MTITTIYKCDKCGAEQAIPSMDSPVQFWQVKISSRPYPLQQFQPYGTAPVTINVCRPCLESFGINVTKQKDKPAPPPPSVEDLIREVIALCTEPQG